MVTSPAGHSVRFFVFWENQVFVRLSFSLGHKSRLWLCMCNLGRDIAENTENFTNTGFSQNVKNGHWLLWFRSAPEINSFCIPTGWRRKRNWKSNGKRNWPRNRRRKRKNWKRQWCRQSGRGRAGFASRQSEWKHSLRPPGGDQSNLAWYWSWSRSISNVNLYSIRCLSWKESIWVEGPYAFGG